MHDAAGLAGIKPVQGLQVLIVALQASAELSSPWPATTAAAAILWDNLLKAPGRRHAMYDDFRVRPVHTHRILQ